ncbi:NB-ARC domain-containing protein [Streptomyces sp. NPDC050560]|uniref:NB-ARC domain-containing protein n=1 Tax=Streptomyces sp. NPDC050560 TaxID=3365630 RepID=UPI0037874212
MDEEQGEGARPVEPGGARNVITGGDFAGLVLQVSGSVGQITYTPPATAGRSPFEVPPLTFRPVDQQQYLDLLDRFVGGAGREDRGIGYGAIDGLPGLGKTTLARRWAGRSNGLFPDGQLFVDYGELRRRAAVGGDVGAALFHCLVTLGCDATAIKPSVEERREQYRCATRGRRILVLLDDVSHPGQVSALIPEGFGSAVLVTSTRRFPELYLDGARPISVAPLDRASALELLAEVAGETRTAAEPAAAERLVELCGRVPKAIWLVATRLLDDVLTIAELVGELADERRRLAGIGMGEENSMSAALEVAYRDLGADAARMYRTLGLLPCRTFDLGTAAAAADVDTTTARALLRQLRATNFLDPAGDGRYRLHDLVRLHARERAERDPGTDEKAVALRVATRYLAQVAWADRALRADRLRLARLGDLLDRVPDPFAGGGPALDWLEAERANIMAVLRAAHRHHLDGVAAPLAEGFVALFLHHRHLDDWLNSLDLGSRCAARAGLTALEARLRSLRSRPLLDLGRYDEAYEELTRAAALAAGSGHAVLQGSVQEFLGRYWDRRDPPTAVLAYRESLRFNTEAGEERGAAIARLFLGQALAATARDLGDESLARARRAEALLTLEKSHAAFLALPAPDVRMAARAQAAVGALRGRLGDTATAEDELRAAIDTLHQVEGPHYEAGARVALADVLQAAGAPLDAVREQLAAAHTIYADGDSPEAEGVRRRLETLGPAADEEQGDTPV